MADWNKYVINIKKNFNWAWHFVFDDFKKQAFNALCVGILAFFVLGIYEQLYRMLGLSVIVGGIFFFLYKFAKLMKG